MFVQHVILKKCKYNAKNEGWKSRYLAICSSCLSCIFVAPKFRLRRVQKMGKKEQKIKNCVLQKLLFFFCVFTSWTLFWASIRIGKPVWGRCARQKKFLNFGNQLRCAILEISSGTHKKRLQVAKIGNFSWGCSSSIKR